MRVGIVAGRSGHVAPFAQRLVRRGCEIAVLPVEATDAEHLDGLLEYTLCRSVEELADGSRAVLVLEDRLDGARHADLARHFLEVRLPVFVDKPLMPGLAVAQELFGLAENCGTPLMSTSSARYALTVRELRRAHAERPLTSLTLSGTGEVWFYGVHLAEIAITVLGCGLETVHSVRDDAGWAVRLRHRSGAVVTLTLESAAGTAEGFGVTARGPGLMGSWALTDYSPWYDLLVDDVLTMARTGRSPVDREETLEVMRLLDAVGRAAPSEYTVLSEGANP